MTDMKTVTVRDLNRNTSGVLDALERGEDFEVRRRGKTVGYLTTTPPPENKKLDWKAHFEWLRKQPKDLGKAVWEEFVASRRSMHERDQRLSGEK